MRGTPLIFTALPLSAAREPLQKSEPHSPARVLRPSSDPTVVPTPPNPPPQRTAALQPRRSATHRLGGWPRAAPRSCEPSTGSSAPCTRSWTLTGRSRHGRSSWRTGPLRLGLTWRRRSRTVRTVPHSSTSKRGREAFSTASFMSFATRMHVGDAAIGGACQHMGAGGLRVPAPRSCHNATRRARHRSSRRHGGHGWARRCPCVTSRALLWWRGWSSVCLGGRSRRNSRR